MRSAGNFSPEWGYLAPAPSMLRTMRVVLVATAIGATAGAGVVLSLVAPSSDNDQVAVGTHAIVTSAQAASVQEGPAMSAAGGVTPVSAGAAPPVVASQIKAGVTAGASAPSAAQSAARMQAAAPPAQASQTQTDHAAQATAMAPPVQEATSAQIPPTITSPANDTSASASQRPVIATQSDEGTAAAEASAVSNDAIAGDQSTVGPQQAPQQKKPKHRTASANNRDFIGTALRHLFSARASTSYYPNRGL